MFCMDSPAAWALRAIRSGRRIHRASTTPRKPATTSAARLDRRSCSSRPKSPLNRPRRCGLNPIGDSRYVHHHPDGAAIESRHPREHHTGDLLMKRLMIIGIGILSLAGLAAATQQAGEHAKAANPQFETLKSLEGTWTGKAGHGDEAMDATVTYKVTAGGSAVMETLFAGQEHEMITMYCLDGSDVVLTHYCVMGNQPHMKLAKPKSADSNVLTFECDGHGGNMKEADRHMHALVLTLVDKDHLKAAWTVHNDKKPGDVANFELTRKPS